MKIKFLSIAFAFVVALALASCGGDKKDASKAEPTGDIDKDVKTIVEKAKSIDVKDEKAVKEYKDFADEFNKYYKDKGDAELKKLTDAIQKAANDDPKLKEANEAINKALDALPSGEEKPDEGGSGSGE